MRVTTEHQGASRWFDGAFADSDDLSLVKSKSLRDYLRDAVIAFEAEYFQQLTKLFSRRVKFEGDGT